MADTEAPATSGHVLDPGSGGRVLCRWILCVLCVALQATTSSAQTQATVVSGPSLEESLNNLLQGIGGTTTESIAALTRLEVSTIPLGTSTGGLTYVYDQATDTVTRRSSMFGPMFTERALTTGRRRLVGGLYHLYASYSSFAGFDLESGDLKPFINVENSPEGIAYTSTQLAIRAHSVVPYAHYGVTENVDVGVALPFVAVELHGTGRWFGNDGNVLDTRVLLPTSSSGIGDIALFGKYNFMRSKADRNSGGTAAAFSVEARLPTGATEDLRGLGIYRTFISYVVSTEFETVSPHMSVGYEIWSREIMFAGSESTLVKDRIRISGGMEWKARRNMTVNIDGVFSGTTGSGKWDYTRITRDSGLAFDALVPTTEAFAELSIVPGLKWNAFGNVIVTANLLWSAYDEGLKTSFVPVVGIEWAPRSR